MASRANLFRIIYTSSSSFTCFEQRFGTFRIFVCFTLSDRGPIPQLITISTYIFKTTLNVIVKTLNDFCHCLHLLCRILTFKLKFLINYCTTWSFANWLKQVMVTWVQPRHQGSLSILCIFVHFLLMPRVTLFAFGKCLPMQFSDMTRI